MSARVFDPDQVPDSRPALRRDQGRCVRAVNERAVVAPQEVVPEARVHVVRKVRVVLAQHELEIVMRQGTHEEGRPRCGYVHATNILGEIVVVGWR